MEQTLKGRPTGLTGGFKNSNFAQAWLILVLALIFGAVLAAVQVNLSQTIRNNKSKETLERIPELVCRAPPVVYPLKTPPNQTLQQSGWV